jgi:putative phosphotransacetylase
MSLNAQIDKAEIARLVSQALQRRLAGGNSSAGVLPAGPRAADGLQAASNPLVVNISVRHLHITQDHLEVLFGPGAELTPLRWLYQEGQFASEQTVDIVGPKRRILPSVRILGPTRSATQIELAFSDAIYLGIDAPVRMSGKITGTPGAILLGPKGHLLLEEGIIRAQRHVHLSPEDAAAYGVSAGDAMDLHIEHATCPLVMQGVIARVDPAFRCEVHIDSDEGNACHLPTASGLRLVKAGNA